MNGTNHKTMSTIDVLFLLGEIEHLRRHNLLAAIVAPDDEAFKYLVLASECQKTRRAVQKHYFPEVEVRDWCIIKSAARLLQLTEELGNGDLDEIKSLKHLVDESILNITGEDISQCESCAKDSSVIES